MSFFKVNTSRARFVKHFKRYQAGVESFVSDRCEREPRPFIGRFETRERIQELYPAYLRWARDRDLAWVVTKSQLIDLLRLAGVKVIQGTGNYLETRGLKLKGA